MKQHPEKVKDNSELCGCCCCAVVVHAEGRAEQGGQLETVMVVDDSLFASVLKKEKKNRKEMTSETDSRLMIWSRNVIENTDNK